MYVDIFKNASTSPIPHISCTPSPTTAPQNFTVLRTSVRQIRNDNHHARHISAGQTSKLLSREKSRGIYTRTLAGIFSYPNIYSFHPPWRGPPGTRGSSRPFIFIGLFPSAARALSEAGGVERSHREENHMRDMIVPRQHALNQAGFMSAGRAKVKAEGGRTVAQSRKPVTLGRDVEPSETLISCSIPAYLFHDLSTFPKVTSSRLGETLAFLEHLLPDSRYPTSEYACNRLTTFRWSATGAIGPSPLRGRRARRVEKNIAANRLIGLSFSHLYSLAVRLNGTVIMRCTGDI